MTFANRPGPQLYHPYIPPMVAVPKGVTREDAEKALAALVPADPADEPLVDEIARAIAYENEAKPFHELAPYIQDQFRNDARTALRIIREQETR